MNRKLGRIFSFAAGAIVITPMACSAQEYFRDLGTSRSSGGIGPVTPSEYTYREAVPSGLEAPEEEIPAVENPDVRLSFGSGSFSQKQAEENYNFALGGFRFSMAAGFGVEFNDNITLSDHDRESDIILRPSFNVDALYHLSDLNTIRFSVGLSYAKFLDHSENDTRGVLISPNSELAFQGVIGPVHLRVRDRVSYQEDPYNVPNLSNVARYRRWENQAGLVADWAVNPGFTLTAGYDHYNLWAVDGGVFADQNRAIDTLLLKPTFNFSPAFKAGINSAYSFIRFTNGDRSNGTNLLVGPFIDWQITPTTDLYVEAGYQDLHFDGTSTLNQATINGFTQEFNLSPAQTAEVTAETSDNSSSSTWYARFELNNKFSDVFQQRLSGSKTSEIGFFSNFYELYHIEYDADYTGIPDTEIGPAIFYEYYKSSGPDEEKASRIGAGFGIRRYLTKSVTVGLDYRYLWKDSNIPGADYYQNLAFLSIYYKF
jgi:hypothetical protein